MATTARLSYQFPANHPAGQWSFISYFSFTFDHLNSFSMASITSSDME